MRTWFLTLSSLLLMHGLCPAELDKRPLVKWLEAQRAYKSAYAEFVQTRKLPELRDPLVSKGKMWAKQPDKFLWKMGEPAEVTVLRNADGFLYLDAAKKEAVKTGTEGRYARQFEILTGEMGNDLGEFEKKFRIERAEQRKGVYYATLQPVNRQFRKRVPWFILAIDVQTSRTAGFDLHLKDGTVIETRFTRYRFNAPVEDGVFKVDTTGYRVKEK